ncbi:MAG: hypothetical protein RBU37_11275 [Myxococcota bacterium]|jgi:hypothetical protein|nr:hypothetical protein [Myxococcota bacterium]
MSDKRHQEAEQYGQDKTGVLLRRMTLASLGMDDLGGVAQVSREAMEGAQRLSERICGSLERLGSPVTIRALSGMPETLFSVQERYLPLNVDVDFGRMAESDGPRTPADLGAWRKLLDAVHLMLFDEDEEELEERLGWRSPVRPAAVRSALQQQLRGQARESFALSAPKRASRAAAAPRVSVALQRAEELASTSQKTQRSDFFSLPEQSRRSLFGDNARVELSSRLGERAEAQSRSAGSLPGVRSAQLEARAQRATLRGAADARLAALLNAPSRTALKALRPASAQDFASLSATQATRTDGSALVPASFERLFGALSVGTALSLSPEQRFEAGEGYTSAQRFAGVPGSLLSLVPDALEQQLAAEMTAGAPLRGTAGSLSASHFAPSQHAPMLRALAPRAPGAETAPATGLASASQMASQMMVSAYPAAMGRAGALNAAMLRELAPSVGATPLSAAVQAVPAMSVQPAATGATTSVSQLAREASARPLSMTDTLRARLLAFARSSTDAGRLMQVLADAPSVRLLAASATALGEPEAGVPSQVAGSELSERRASHEASRGTEQALHLARMGLGEQAMGRWEQLGEELSSMGLASSLGQSSSDARAGALRLIERVLGRMTAERASTYRPDSAGQLLRPESSRPEGEDEAHSGDLRNADVDRMLRQLAARTQAASQAQRPGVDTALEPAVSDSLRVMLRDLGVAATQQVLQQLSRAFTRRERVTLGVAEQSKLDGLGLTALLRLLAPSAQESVSLRAPIASDAAAVASSGARPGGLSAVSSPAGFVSVSDKGELLDGRFVPSLAAALRQRTRTERLAASAQRTERSALTQEEGTQTRLARMLQLAQVGDHESELIRSNFENLRASGVLPAASRLSWQQSEPVLLQMEASASQPGVAQDTYEQGGLRALLEGRVSSAELRALRERMPSVDLSVQRPSGQLAQVEQSQRRELAPSADLARMMGLSKATQVLLDDVLAGRADSAKLFEQSVLGELLRTRSSSLRPQLEAETAMLQPQRTRAVQARESAESAKSMASTFVESMGMAERQRISLSLEGLSPEERRSMLSLREMQPQRGMAVSEPGFEGLTRVRSAQGEQETVGETLQALARAQSAQPLELRLDVEEPRRLLSGASSFDPQVLSLAMHEQRVAAELERARSAVPSGVRPEEAGSVPGIAAPDLGALRLRFGARVLTQMMHSASASADGNARLQEVYSTIREVVGRQGSSSERIVAELSQRIPGFEPLAQVASARPEDAARIEVSRALRTVERAMERFDVSQAAREPSTAGYFASLVPSAFEPAAPSRILASVFGVEAAGADGVEQALTERLHRARERAERVALQSGVMLELGGAEPSVSSEEPQASLASAGSARYEELRAETMSRMIRRFLPSVSAATRSAAEQRSVTLRDGSEHALVTSQSMSGAPVSAGVQFTRPMVRVGEPGEMGEALQRFVPTGATPQLVRSGVAQQPAELESAAPAPAAGRPLTGTRLSDLFPTEAAQQALVTELAQQVESTLSAQGASVVYVGVEAAANKLSEQLFGLGSGSRAATQASRYDAGHAVRRIEGLLDRVEGLSERASRVLGEQSSSAMARVGIDLGAGQDGLPPWRRKGTQFQGVDVSELREMLRQVGAMRVQGDTVNGERSLVNPFAGLPTDVGAGAQPLMKGGGSGAETKPASEVQSQEQAFAATDAGVPPYEELMLIAEEVYRRIMEKLREELQRRRSE